MYSCCSEIRSVKGKSFYCKSAVGTITKGSSLAAFGCPLEPKCLQVTVILAHDSTEVTTKATQAGWLHRIPEGPGVCSGVCSRVYCICYVIVLHDGDDHDDDDDGDGNGDGDSDDVDDDDDDDDYRDDDADVVDYGEDE